MRLVVLAEQVLAVVVAVWSAHYAVNVLARRQVGVLGEAREIRGTLVIEFDQDHGAVDAVVVDARRIRATDPGEAGAVDLPLQPHPS